MTLQTKSAGTVQVVKRPPARLVQRRLLSRTCVSLVKCESQRMKSLGIGWLGAGCHLQLTATPMESTESRRSKRWCSRPSSMGSHSSPQSQLLASASSSDCESPSFQTMKQVANLGETALVKWPWVSLYLLVRCGILNLYKGSGFFLATVFYQCWNVSNGLARIEPMPEGLLPHAALWSHSIFCTSAALWQ